MKTNNFFKIYIKYFFFAIIFSIVTVISLFLLINIVKYIGDKNPYNNYYENNYNELNELKDYLLKNTNISWHVYTDKNKYPNLVENNNWEENCFYWSCSILNLNTIDNIKTLNINYLSVSDWIITINTKYNLYWDKNNQIYYSKWYYKWKKELDEIDENRFNVIVKIFNDDWGVINWCYGCFAWAWD